VASVTGAFSVQGVVVMGAGGAPVPCLLGEGRTKPPSLLDAMRNFSEKSSIMARCGDGVPLRVELVKVASESPLLGERLRPPK
jgi:hypothetical protein